MIRISRLVFLSLLALVLPALLALAAPRAHSAPREASRAHWPAPEVDTGHDTGQ